MPFSRHTEQITEIWFNEKEPTIHIRTHNTDLKKRLSAYTEKFPIECRLFDDDPELGCMEFEIAKGRLSFRLTEPYSDESTGEWQANMLRKTG